METSLPRSATAALLQMLNGALAPAPDEDGVTKPALTAAKLKRFIPHIPEDYDERAKAIADMRRVAKRLQARDASRDIFAKDVFEDKEIPEMLCVLALISTGIRISDQTRASLILKIRPETLLNRVKEGRIQAIPLPSGRLVFLDGDLAAAKPEVHFQKSRQRQLCKCCGQPIPKKLQEKLDAETTAKSADQTQAP